MASRDRMFIADLVTVQRAVRLAREPHLHRNAQAATSNLLRLLSDAVAVFDDFSEELAPEYRMAAFLKATDALASKSAEGLPPAQQARILSFLADILVSRAETLRKNSRRPVPAEPASRRAVHLAESKAFHTYLEKHINWYRQPIITHGAALDAILGLTGAALTTDLDSCPAARHAFANLEKNFNDWETGESENAHHH